MRIGLKEKCFTKSKKNNNNRHTQKVFARLVDSENWLNFFFFTKTFKNNNTPTQFFFVRLVDSENWSKKMYLQKNTKKQYAQTKSVARLVDRENCFKKNVLQKEKNKTIRPHKKCW